MDSIIPAFVLSTATLVNNALSSAKAAKELIRQSGDSDLKDRISDLIDSVLEVKVRVLELDEENRSLKDQLAQKAAVKRHPEFGYYFVDGDSDPLCPKCYEASGKQIHLPASEPWCRGIRRLCFECHHTFWEEPVNSRPAKPLIIPRSNWR